MAYNLPPPWDPGFALPDNVLDEGLERRAFVTKWMPRGTYDAPKVGTAGYAVPEYITKSGYGQGEKVTKWMPRGTQPNVPAYLDRRPKLVSQRSLPGGGNAATFALSGTDGIPPAFTAFGEGTARIILRGVARVPHLEQKTALKMILDAIDPSLWTRVAATANRLASRGTAPKLALYIALAHNMSTGISREIIALGMQRLGMQTPQSGPPRGLGRSHTYEALGELPNFTVMASFLKVPTPASCPPGYSWSAQTPPPRAGVSWQMATPQREGMWVRTPDGQADQPRPAGCYPPPEVARELRGGPQYLWNATTGVYELNPNYIPPLTAAEIAQQFPSVQIGPWTIDGRLSQWSIVIKRGTLPAEWTQFLTQALAKISQESKRRALPLGGPVRVNLRFLGQEGYGELPKALVTGTAPFAKFENTARGNEMWGLYISDVMDDGAFRISFHKIEPNFLEKIWDFIQNVREGVHDLVKGVLDEVGDLTCELLGSKGAPVAGAAVSTYYTGNPQVGAAGVQSAQGMCPPPPPPLPPQPPSANNLLPLAIGGGLLIAAAIVLTKKKKATP